MLENITAVTIDGITFLLKTGSTIIRPIETTIIISARVIWLTDILPVILKQKSQSKLK